MSLSERLESALWRLPLTSQVLALWGASLYRLAYRMNATMRFLPVPRSVHLLLTMKCNSYCKHCEASAGSEMGDELATHEVIDLLQNLGRLKTVRVIFTGGEVLLRNDIFELIRAAKQLGLSVTLATNGLLIEELQQSLADALPDAVFTSVDGLQGLHDEVRGVPGAFERTISAIQLMRTMPIDQIIVNTVVTDDNIETLEELGHQIFNAGATHWELSPIMNVGRAKKAEDFDISRATAERLADFLACKPLAGRVELSEICGALGLDDRTARHRPFFCGAGYKTCSVMETGEVLPCHIVYDKRLTVGNIRQEAFDVLWKKCATVVEKTPLPSHCATCSIYKGCLGGCWACRFHGNRCLKRTIEDGSHRR
jgi:radical SAM protein with 4Fe4S-binding SPASM domain